MLVPVTDQDYDGFQIFGLIVNFIYRLWPELISLGFIGRINTPIVKIYPKNKRDPVINIYDLKDKDKFVNNHAHDLDKYYIKYCKGLGNNTKEDAKEIFKDFNSKLISCMPSEDIDKIMTIYYDKETDGRKIKFSNPPIDKGNIFNSDRLFITDFIEIYVHSFHIDNLSRKLLGIDGLNEVNRKILYTIKKLPKQQHPIEVYKFAARVAENSAYHHGDGPLCGAVIKSLQCYPGGGKNYPINLPVGEYGSRSEFGHDAASPRYLNVIPNYKLVEVLFPTCDDPLLQYQKDNDDIIEPFAYIPIVPFSIMEYYNVPASGWKSTILPIKFHSVKNVVLKLMDHCLNNDNTTFDKNLLQDLPFRLIMEFEDRGFRNKIERIELNSGIEKRHRICSFGEMYVENKRNKSIINIKELPMYVSTLGYKNSIISSKLTSDEINSLSDPDVVDITFTANEHLPSGRITDFETLSKYHLVEYYTPCINIIKPDKTVYECNTRYTEAVLLWFPYRVKLYVSRIKKLVTHNLTKIIRLINIIHFIEMANTKKLNVDGLIKETAIMKLTLLKFTKLSFVSNKKNLFNEIGDYKNLLHEFYNNPDYEYLFVLNANDKFDDKLKSMKEKLNELIQQLLKYEAVIIIDSNEIYLNKLKYTFDKIIEIPFEKISNIVITNKIIYNVWINELNELENVINAGHSINWCYK